MKTTLTKIRLLTAALLLSVFTGDLCAQQLSGMYTINSGAATSGNNFQTFTDFATAVSSNGVSGPVTVDVVSSTGPYNEQVTFLQIAGASLLNKITINGNGNIVEYTGNSSQPWTIGLNGTDYMVINNLQVRGLDATYAYALKLWGGADYNVFSGCSFSVTPNNTSTYGIPVSISGSGTNYNTYSNSGNYNRFLNCSTFSGYHGISIYGPTSDPYTLGNEVTGCTIQDFYYGGIYGYYQQGGIVKNNIVECPTRTNTTTKAGIYYYVCQNMLVEGNHVRDLYNSNTQNLTGTCYGMFVSYNMDSYWNYLFLPSRYPNLIRNNIVSDITFNGTIYGIYAYGYDGEMYHNTISLDHTGATSGTTYGIYQYAYQANYKSHVKNNIITVSRGGSGTKYCFYNASNSGGSDVTCDRNNFYMNSTSGTNYVGYYVGGAATTHGQLQSQGANTTGFSVDPAYANMASKDYHPTNVAINNAGLQLGIQLDQKGAVRHPSTPDIGALEFLTPLCTGTPTQTVAGPNYELCSGETAAFSIGGLSSDDGYVYQWQMSNLSAVGPFTFVTNPSPTGITYTSSPNFNTMWYSAIITCTAPGGGSVQAVSQVSIAATTTNSVPYYENFEGIGLPNRLPNCSWSSPNLGSTASTHVGSSAGNLLPRSGNSFASFSNSTPGSNYFYSNGIYMVPGITYSASLWYLTDLTGANNWSDLSIMIGTTQSTTGLTTIATTGGPAVALVHKSLSNTFTVATAGLYYVAIKATGASGTAKNLSWDDLAIEIPCSLNSPAISLSANKSVVCAGESVVITASGASSYQWNNGAGTSSLVTVTPLYSSNYSVIGTNVSACSGSASVYIQVNPTPVVGVVSLPATACAGAPVNLQAYGAASYNWSNNKTGNSIIVAPTVATSYTVQGTNSFGCMKATVYQLNPLASPVITAVGPTGAVCRGDEAPASASGANSYVWKSNNIMVVGNPASLYPNTPTTYTVEGTDENGCKGETTLFVNVVDCTGLTETGQTSSVKVYPNPTSGAFTIEMNVTGNSLVQVTDVTGRVIISQEVNTNSFDVNISAFAAGIYYVQVSNGDVVERIKVIRN